MRAPLFILTALLVMGCSTKHKGSYELATASASVAAPSTLEQADALWAERADKAKLQQALALYEQAIGADPSNRQVAGRLVRGWYFLGDAYETTDEARLAAWDTAITWGKHCLAINPEFTALLAKGDEDEASAVRVLVAEDVPCLYWTSSALGKWAKLSGIGKTLKNLPTVKAYMTRVGELEPQYFYSGPDRYWGAYYSAIPSFAGRDLDKSKEYLDKAIAANPEHLGARVIKADYWATKMQDKASFEAILNEVLAADPNVDPTIAPENLAEQAKARDLLARKDEFFVD